MLMGTISATVARLKTTGSNASQHVQVAAACVDQLQQHAAASHNANAPSSSLVSAHPTQFCLAARPARCYMSLQACTCICVLPLSCRTVLRNSPARCSLEASAEGLTCLEPCAGSKFRSFGSHARISAYASGYADRASGARCWRRQPVSVKMI